MTRAILIALAVSSAAAAQQPPPLPLPDAPKSGASALPLPLPEQKPAKKKAEQKAAPALDAAPAAQKQPAGTMPLFDGAPAPKPPAVTAAPAVTATPKAIPATDTFAAPRTTPATSTAPAPSAARYATTGTAAPGAATSMPAAPMNDLRLRPDWSSQLWTVRAFVGGERSTESDYTDSASDYHLGLEGTRWFSGTWLARGEIDWRNSSQPYVPLHSAGGAGQQVNVDENRFDVLATVGYDFGPRLLENGRLELTPMLGLQYLAIRNGAFPSDLIGPNIAGRARYSLSSAIVLQATVGYTYNLSVASTQNSALKAPVGDFSARAGIGLPMAGGYELELDYSGDVLGFQNTYRVANGAALGFGTTF